MVPLNKNDINKVHHTKSIEKMLEWIILENPNKSKNDKTIELWYTNSTKFDADFILKSLLLKRGFKQTLNTNLQENEFSLLEPTKIGKLTIRFKWENYIFEVRDFKLYVSLSVKEKGLIVGVEKGSYKNKNFVWLNNKGEIDWEKFNWEKITNDEYEAVIYYAKKDALIDALYLQKHFSLLGKPTKLTKSGEAFKRATEAVKKENEKSKLKMTLIIPNDEDVWTNHMQGGMNYANKNFLFKLLKNVLEYDVTNMYVSNMTKPLPINNGSQYGDKNDIKLYRIIFKKISIKENLKDTIGQGFIPTKITKEKIFKHDFITKQYAISGKNFEHEIWDKEFEWYKKIYDMEYDIIDTKFFKAGTHLKPLMISLFEERKEEKILAQKYKDLNDLENYSIHEILQNDKKITGNSIYGVLAENPEKEQYFYSQDKYKIGEKIPSNKPEREIYVTGKSPQNFQGYTKYITKTANKPEFRKNIYIGSYITMLGRIDMYEPILSGLIVRVDTDGYTALNSYKIPEGKINNKLGGTKLELSKMKKYFMLVGYKAYFYSNTNTFEKDTSITFKGLRKLNIPFGTKLEEINWKTTQGISIEKKSTEKGLKLNKVTKNLNIQRYYLKHVSNTNS